MICRKCNGNKWIELSEYRMCSLCHYKVFNYEFELIQQNNSLREELIKVKQEIESLKEIIKSREHNIKDIIKEIGDYSGEFVLMPRDVYSQLVDARKEIVLLKEQLDNKKETYRLTRKDVLEIVRDEIKNIYPFTFGYFDNSEKLDGQVIPKEATRLCKGFWIDEMGDIVDKKQVRKLEEHYKKYVNKNG